jgi:hypothetical protein
MVALSFKLPESIVHSLRTFSKERGISQTSIIEVSLTEWIEKEKQREIEESFKRYV